MIALIATLSTAPVHPIMANNSNTSVATSVVTDAEASKWLEPLVVGSVRVENNVTFTIQELAMLQGSSNNVVTFSIKVTNNSNKEFQFVDYWVRLQTKTGVTFSLSLLDQDRDKNRIPAGTTQELRFVANVSGNFTMHDLEFKILKYDFKPSNFDSDYVVVVGTVSVPANYTNRTPVGLSKVVSVNGVPLLTNITRVVMNTGTQYNMPTIYFEMENIGNKSITVPNYEFFVRTSEGLMYPLEVSGMPSNTSIHPRFNRELQLSGTMPSNVSLNNWELVITVKESGARDALPVAFYHMPAPDSGHDSGAIPAGEIKTLEIANTAIETSVKRVLAAKGAEHLDATIYYVMKNTGTSPVTVPNYQFMLETANGLSYPVSADNFNNLMINPQVSKEITLHVSVPVEISLEGASLQLYAKQEGQTPDAKGILTASYHLPSANASNAVSGNTAEITNKYGVYSIQLNGIERLPLDDADVLNANLIVKNRSLDSLPIPVLEGKFVLDGVVEVPVKVVQSDNVIGMQSGEEIRFHMYGTIPYTYRYTTLKLVLSERIDDKHSNQLVEFERNASTSRLPVIPSGSIYEITGVGKNAALAIKSVRTYPGIDGTLLNVLVNVQNLERRFTETPNIVAYFKTKNDEMYPAVISDLKEKIGPRSVATINVSGVLPKDTKSEDLQLIVGEAVGDLAYVNAVSFSFPVEDTQPQNHFTKMDFFPYEVSFSNIRADIISENRFRLAFDYELSKSLITNTDQGDHKLILEFKDRDGDLKFSEVIELGSANGLEPGTGTKEFFQTDSLILQRLPYLQYYVINVYDEYKGVKKLLATQQFSWFGD